LIDQLDLKQQNVTDFREEPIQRKNKKRIKQKTV